MKRTLLIVLSACALLVLMAGYAFAEGSGELNGDYYENTAQATHTWTSGIGVDGNGMYMDAETNPHGGFTQTSHNCQVCHSVHHADTGGEALLPDTVANACIYCHITSATGYIQIYDNNAANYTDANDFGHQAEGGATCVTCHQVHAASDEMVSAGLYGNQDYLVEKILKVTAAEPLLDAQGAAIAFTNAEADETAVSEWCTRCHKDDGGTMGYYNTAYNSMTHTMQNPTNNYQSSSGVKGTIAESTSQYCSSCHQNGDLDMTQPMVAVYSQYNFPHWSAGVRFLNSTSLDANGMPDTEAAATDSHEDGVCLNCHRGATVTNDGVGIGW